MDFLFDTNIFLEVLLGQEKKESCKKLLVDFKGIIFLSEFSIHSIGVILFKQKKFAIFDNFISDIAHNGSIISLPLVKYPQISIIAQKYHLDFDDAIQTAVAIEHKLGIITIDNDFKKVAKALTVQFV
ncbi:MAG: type II toxin-antitoxin system VapC family toxin [Bacteroidales bacterium]|nr:type II toxin-antitoxin system VapC family toxin [Bacteroidales bacterium]